MHNLMNFIVVFCLNFIANLNMYICIYTTFQLIIINVHSIDVVQQCLMSTDLMNIYINCIFLRNKTLFLFLHSNDKFHSQAMIIAFPRFINNSLHL